MTLELIIPIVGGIWLIGLTIAFILQQRFFNKLTKNVDEKNFKKVLEKILKNLKTDENLIKELQREITKLEKRGEFHVQKIGLVRFNPFREIGGEHSFSFAVLDGKDNGIVVTGLHTRERTRVYTKKIVNGKSDLNLSSEEKKAISNAIKK